MSFAALKPRTAGAPSVVFQASADLIRTWHDAKRTVAARWHEHEVHLAKPRSEFLGPGLDAITFSMRFDAAHGVVPRDELRDLRKLCGTGEILQFTIGGELVGDFTLRDVADEWKSFDARGVLLIAIASITLKEYV